MTDLLKDYHAFVRFLYFMQKIVGIRTFFKDGGIFQRILLLWTLIVSLISSGGTIYTCILNVSHITTFTRALGYAGTCLTIVIKIFSFLLYNQRVRELNDDFIESFENDLLTAEYVPYLLCRLKKFSKPSYIFGGVLIFLATSYIVSPIIVLLIYKKRILVLPSSYPWDTKNDIKIYTITFVIECWMSVSICAVSVSIDALYCFYQMIICDIKTYSRQLSDCVKRYSVVIRHKVNIETIFGPICIWMFISTSIIICGQVFQAVLKISFLLLFRLLSYVLVKLQLTFIFSWISEYINIESENCLKAVYGSLWPEYANTAMMRNIALITVHKPLRLKAYGFFVISMEMFSKIVNTSVSYFFLLQTLA